MSGKVVEERNCSNGTSITIDLSYNRSKDKKKYCCSIHGASAGKVTITYRSVKVGSSKEIDYYQHSINGPADKLAHIKYCRKDDRSVKNITAPGLLESPITGPVTVYAFHCNENPVLIHVEKNENPIIDKWFQRGAQDDSQWSQVRDQLDDVTPKIGNNCAKFKKLANVLRSFQCSDITDCTPAPSYGISGEQDTLVSFESTDTSQDATIKLQFKQNNTESTQYPGDETGIGKTIKVNKRDGPSSIFIKYEHNLEDDGPFKLKEVWKENDNKINEIKGESNVTSVYAYYWKDRTGKNPLFIEVISDGGNKHTYYANSSSGWNKYTPEYESGNKLSKEELKHKLTLINCDINHVVQINVAETGTQPYCHTPDPTDGTAHTHKRIKVQDADSSKSLIHYKAYAHTPNNGSEKFNISAFKNGDRDITLPLSELPVMEAEKVIVFMCENRSSEKTPLLIYIDAPTLKTPSPNKQWFKKTGADWNAVDSGAPSSPTSYTQILDILDGLTSDCAPPEVTIKIDERNVTGGTHNYEDTSVPPGKTINVEKDDKLKDVPGFTEYKHKVEGRNYFTLKQINFGTEQATDFGTPTPKVSTVSVYYWTALEKANKSESRPLLVKVTLHDKTDKWYKNSGQNNKDLKWEAVNNPSHVTGNNLKSKLILLNCKLNSVTTIDIGKRPKDNYCHTPDPSIGEGSHDPLIKVTDASKDPIYKDKIGRFVVYEHIVDPDVSSQRSFGNKFHISGFKNGTNIKLNGSPPAIPALYVPKVLVYFCVVLVPGQSLSYSMLNILILEVVNRRTGLRSLIMMVILGLSLKWERNHLMRMILRLSGTF